MYSLTNRNFASKMQVLGLSIALLAFAATPTLAATLTIQFTGMDLVYNGSTIYDAGNAAGGNTNPAEADPLTSATFSIDGNPVGTLTNDLFLDVIIPDVTGISAILPFDDLTTPGTTPGVFDLLIGSPVATQGLQLTLGEVYVGYLNSIAGTFTFGATATVADISAANLPFGLQIGDPVNVSFSAQVSNATNNGVNITGFTAAGTGEITGTAIPEPSSCVLAALGLVAGLACRGWNRRR